MNEAEESIKRRFELIEALLSERTRRLVAAAEARVMGHGGISSASRATGVSRRAIQAGLKELDEIKSGEHPGNGGDGKVRRAASLDPNRPPDIGTTGRLDRTDDKRRSGISAAVDLQKPPDTCGRVEPTRRKGQSHQRRGTTGISGVQLAGQ